MSEMFKATDKVAALKLPVCDSLMLRSGDIPWQDSDAAGFWVKPLIEDEDKGIRTWLMKVDAGAFSEMYWGARFMIRTTPTARVISLCGPRARCIRRAVKRALWYCSSIRLAKIERPLKHRKRRSDWPGLLIRS